MNDDQERAEYEGDKTLSLFSCDTTDSVCILEL